MLSIENLYWILYENLLKPTDIDCWYYYPFGTTNNLSRDTEFLHAPRTTTSPAHALFHFDQEPIWNDSLGILYDIDNTTWSNKMIKILANSEKSQIKEKVCKERGLLDWYFFYHGFASLDWFRDSQYIIDQQKIKNVFLSFNHLIRNSRSYRVALLARMIDRNILHQGSVSFYGTAEDCFNEVMDPDTKISEYGKVLIKKTLEKNIDLPMILDRKVLDGNFSAHFGHQEYKMWQQSFLHIVNETVFYEPKLHLTEKIFKPIVALRPFVLVSAPGNLEYLRSYGFKTFGDWWDESYDTIQDPDLRLDAITEQVFSLCARPFHEIENMLSDMQPILQFNKKHFFTDFKKIIVDELVDNFESCIKFWNNGRVDGRAVPFHPDLNTTKEILLG